MKYKREEQARKMKNIEEKLKLRAIYEKQMSDHKKSSQFEDEKS